ncbi:hypothetical protein QYM36_010044 [Artemia franciscana]|uniref:Novel acetylcholine receptor chaperone n=1 Tax=Artemia franciscana TaxID=6661 RepID=A0AA88HUF3_ARTSF|nr:hypothetical protein QYM36_010044 [Artemia franciscana]
MGSVVLKTLSILLGVFFVLVGVLKITPFISRELHRDLRKEFVKYAKVFPLSKTLEFKVSPKWYRRVIGGFEVALGIVLALIPHARLRQIANGILTAMMALAIYSHWMVNDKFERLAPTLVWLFFYFTFFWS